MSAPRLTPEPNGTVRVTPPDAWWCVDCGRLRVLDEWDRCEPCAATASAEARRIADQVMPAIGEKIGRAHV